MIGKTKLTFDEQVKPVETLKNITVLDFQARPDRVVYILQNGDNAYAIVNNDCTMYEDGRIVKLDKTTHEITKGDRDVLFAKLANKDRILDEVLTDYFGIKYSCSICNLPASIKIETGSMAKTKDSYATFQDANPHSDADESIILGMLNTDIVMYLEHFLVPSNIANRMRKLIKTSEKKQ